VFPQPKTANPIASYNGNPAGPNSVKIFSITTASYSITFGLVEADPYFTIPFITVEGVIFSAKIIRASEHNMVVFGSPILSARKGNDTLAPLTPTLNALPYIFIIKFIAALTKLALLSFQSFYLILMNLTECSIISKGIPSSNSQSANRSYPVTFISHFASSNKLIISSPTLDLIIVSVSSLVSAGAKSLSVIFGFLLGIITHYSLGTSSEALAVSILTSSGCSLGFSYAFCCLARNPAGGPAGFLIG
jgi:hypothetical protein